jgi:hypothetical protein
VRVVAVLLVAAGKTFWCTEPIGTHLDEPRHGEPPLGTRRQRAGVEPDNFASDQATALDSNLTSNCRRIGVQAAATSGSGGAARWASCRSGSPRRGDGSIVTDLGAERLLLLHTLDELKDVVVSLEPRGDSAQQALEETLELRRGGGGDVPAGCVPSPTLDTLRYEAGAMRMLVGCAGVLFAVTLLWSLASDEERLEALGTMVHSDFFIYLPDSLRQLEALTALMDGGTAGARGGGTAARDSLRAFCGSFFSKLRVQGPDT